MKAVFLALLFVGCAYGDVVPFADGPKCPIKDPLTIPAGPITITLGDPNGDFILSLDASSKHGGGVATGLSTARFSYTVNPIALKATFEASITGKVCADGASYTAKGQINGKPFSKDVIPTGSFEGEGSYHACASDATIAGSIQMAVNMVTGIVTVKTLELTKMDASNLDFNLENMKLDGVLVPWEQYSKDFKANFDRELPAARKEFGERIKGVANHFLKGLTLEELLKKFEGIDKPCN